MDPCSPNHHPAPGDRAASDLGAAETVFVTALRCWVAPIMHPESRHPDWQPVLRLAGLDNVSLAEFDVLMAILARSAKRMLEVRCCRCPSLGADEIAMLELVGSQQAGDAVGALSVLSDWLPSPAIRPALLAVRHFSADMLAAGLRVPVLAAGGGGRTALPRDISLH